MDLGSEIGAGLTRRRLIGIASASFLVAARPGAAQAEAVYRVGYLSSSATVFEPFRQGLRQLGYVEGQNAVIEAKLAAG